MWRKQDSGRIVGLRFLYNKTPAMLRWVPKIRWLLEMVILCWGVCTVHQPVIEYEFPQKRTYPQVRRHSLAETILEKGLTAERWQSITFLVAGRLSPLILNGRCMCVWGGGGGSGNLGSPSAYLPQMNILIFLSYEKTRHLWLLWFWFSHLIMLGLRHASLSLFLVLFSICSSWSFFMMAWWQLQP